MLKGILVVAVAAGSGWLFVFQVLVPWLCDQPMFPFFRHPEVRELEEMIAEAKQDSRLDDMARELHDARSPRKKEPLS